MYKDIREDIYKEKISLYLSFLYITKAKGRYNRRRKAGYLKSKSFLSRGCRVEVLSINFIDEFYSLKRILNLLKGNIKRVY